MSSTKTVSYLKWSKEIDQFAREKDIDGYLEQLFDVTQQLFPMARAISVCLEPDMELPNTVFLIFDVFLRDLSQDDANSIRNQWIDHLMRICPSPEIGYFSLVINWE